MTCKTEFPDFDYELPTLEGFTDASWHNDAMPHLTNDLLNVWCDYANPSKREYEKQYPRFELATQDGFVIVASDNFDVVRGAVANIMGELEYTIEDNRNRDREGNAMVEVAMMSGGLMLKTETFYNRAQAIEWLAQFPNAEKA